MENTLALANFFVARSLETGVPITLTKLVKLVYIAHGWHLGLTEKPLLPEAVEAWKYGPVVASVYHQFKSYGSEPIIAFAKEFRGTNLEAPHINQAELLPFLYRIWEVYHSFDVLTLANMCQAEGTPWSRVWHHISHQPAQSVLLIPNEIIKQYYEAVIQGRKKEQV